MSVDELLAIPDLARETVVQFVQRRTVRAVTRCRAFLLLPLISLVLSSQLGAAVRSFAQLSIPTGIATDAGGHVFVTSDAVVTTLLTAFEPTGQPLGSIQIGGITVGNLGHLAVDPATGTIWDLLSNGDILLIDAQSGQMGRLLNLRSIAVDVSQVFDVASRTMGPFTGMLPQNSTYGDIALSRRNGNLDVFVSGVSIAFPFLMRVRFFPNNTFSASVLIASRASSADYIAYSDSPRGVAINSSGMVLTTLPAASLDQPGIMDHLFVFSADFPETHTSFPTQWSSEQLFSRGMTTDSKGNFYVASGAIGVAVCGAGGSGAILRLSADLRQASCLNSGVAIAESEDVAISPQNDVVYATIRGSNLVIAAGLADFTVPQ